MLLNALLLSLIPFTTSLKFLAYNPAIGQSHAQYINKIAEILHDAGHEISNIDITGYVVASNEWKSKDELSKAVEGLVISVPMSEEAQTSAKRDGEAAEKSFWSYKGILDLIKIVRSVTDAGKKQCNVTIHHPGLLDSLREEKFDGAFSEPFECCGFGIFHLLGIKSYGMAMAVPSVDNTFTITGLPHLTSYVPCMTSPYGPKMTFLQRVQNILSAKAEAIFLDYNFERMWDTFNDFQPGFPSIKKWNEVLDLRPHTVLISFGTVAKASEMPQEYKDALKEAFRRLPHVTFIWKYEISEHKISEGIDNVIEAPYVPQKELFKDSRLTGFMTHGGAGSMVELLHYGVPTVVVPLAGEQTRSGPMIERLGTGVKVLRSDLHDPDVIEDALRKIVYDKSYKTSAERVAARLRDQPFSARDRVLRSMEFMAEHGPLHFLKHESANLNTLQLFSIDVVAFLFVAMIIAAFMIVCVTILIARILFKWIYLHYKHKID